MNRIDQILAILLLLFWGHHVIYNPGAWAADTTQAGQHLKAEVFTKIGGVLHGIAFDRKGHMFVGKNGKEIFKVTPKGEASLFTVIDAAEGYFIEGPGNTFLYDMEFGPDGYLYAAVEDRILKISPDGGIVTLLQSKFPGIWGTCGIALDRSGNIFFSYDNRIEKLTPQGRRELFLDGKETRIALHAIVGIDFDLGQQHLYACDGKIGEGKLVKIPIASDGSAEPVQSIFASKTVNTEYMALAGGNIVIKGPWTTEFIRIAENGRATPFTCSPLGFGVQTIAMGGPGFDRKAVYGTQMSMGVIYKIRLP